LVAASLLFVWDGGARLAADSPAAGQPAGSVPDMVVTATRGPQTLAALPFSAAVVPTERAVEQGRLMPNLPEMLQGIPGVMVQKTANGQASPYLRGFTGFRNVMLVDGIRLNNSVFRDGPNQYWTLVDALATERLEVVKGTGAVLYGSDAVGGVVNALSVPTGLSLAPGEWERHVLARYGTADGGFSGHADARGNLAGRIGWQVGGSLHPGEDLRGGRDVGRQEQTAYDEWDGDLKLDLDLGSGRLATLAWQHAAQNDVWRSHRTAYGFSWEDSAVGTDLQDSFDHSRDLAYLKYREDGQEGWYESMELCLSWQELDEDELRVRGNGRREKQGFAVDTAGLLLAFRSPVPWGTLTYGLDFYHDRVDSYKHVYTAAGTLQSIELQGPVADAATYDSLGVFLQGEVKLGERANLILGGRYARAEADADKVRDPVTGARTSVDGHWDAVVGQAMLMVGLDAQRRVNAFAGVSQAFRAPNLSDLTRYDIARTNELETPAPNLDPEHYLTFEAGLKLDLEKVSAEVALFHTVIDDMIVRTPTGAVVGGLQEVTKRNAGDGEVDGVEISGTWRCRDDLRLRLGFTWLEGEVEGYPTAAPVSQTEYLSRIMPWTATAALTWEPRLCRRPCFVTAEAVVAGDQDKLSASDRSDTQRIPPGGTPGYTVFNLRLGCHVSERLTVALALENCFDEDYRIHGSGVNEPGRNLVATLDFRF